MTASTMHSIIIIITIIIIIIVTIIIIITIIITITRRCQRSKAHRLLTASTMHSIIIITTIIIIIIIITIIIITIFTTTIIIIIFTTIIIIIITIIITIINSSTRRCQRCRAQRLLMLTASTMHSTRCPQRRGQASLPSFAACTDTGGNTALGLLWLQAE